MNFLDGEATNFSVETSHVVDSFGGKAQVVDSVVGPVFIDVIDVFSRLRQYAMGQKEDQAVLHPQFSVTPKANVPIRTFATYIVIDVVSPSTTFSDYKSGSKVYGYQLVVLEM